MLLDEWKMWTPVLDTKTAQKLHQLDRYWIFGVTDQTVNCIPLKGSEESPPTFPRPVPTVLQLSIPLCQRELEVTTMEEK